jgi:hypothetical protein
LAGYFVIPLKKFIKKLMSLYTPLKKAALKLSMFIDFDKDNKRFYNNLYLKDFKFVVKMPLGTEKVPKEEIKIEKFDLTKYCYLVDY